MLQELDCAVEPEFSATALEDSFRAEQEHAELAREEMEMSTQQTAADIDRDWAMTYLIARLPKDAYFHLQNLRTVKRAFGRIEHDDEWVASAIAGSDLNAPVVSSHRCPTPAEAAMQLVERFLPVAEADGRLTELGTIDPNTLSGLRTIVEGRCGRSDFLMCDDAGRVTVRGYVDPSELHELRADVAEHNRAKAGVAA